MIQYQVSLNWSTVLGEHWRYDLDNDENDLENKQKYTEFIHQLEDEGTPDDKVHQLYGQSQSSSLHDDPEKHKKKK